MSAYLCTDEHFQQLAGWACNDDRGSLVWLGERVGYTPGHSSGMQHDELASYIATMLLRENERSLEARYGDEVSTRQLVVTYGEVRRAGRIEPVKIAKALACYEYQSCEHDDWEQSRAHWFVQYCRKEAFNRTPGYSDANWGAPIETRLVA